MQKCSGKLIDASLFITCVFFYMCYQNKVCAAQIFILDIALTLWPATP